MSLSGFFKRKKKKEADDFNFDDEYGFPVETDGESGGKNSGRTSTISANKNNNVPCDFVNMVPFDWAKPIVSEFIGKKLNREVFKRVFLYLILFAVFASAYGAVNYFEKGREYLLDTKTREFGKKIAEYEAVADNLSVYKSYIEIPNNPPVYTQFYGVSFLAVRNGLLVGKTSYSSTLSGDAGARVSRDGFALETGKRIEDIDIRGVWTLTGTISPRIGSVADSNWSMNFSKQVNVLFGRLRVNAYTRVATSSGTGRGSGNDSDVVVTILLWK
jgi:hypothetical protein